MRYNTNQHTLSFQEVQHTSGHEITMGEFFAGGGGWTAGCDQVPGIKTKWILNHDAKAIECNAHHHKGVNVYWSDVYVQDEHELERVDHVHASVECTQHSNANGGGSKKLGSYTMGWELVRYIKYLLPNSISIENVREFKKWSPTDTEGNPIKGCEGQEFERWKAEIMSFGYEYSESIRNAADDGLQTSRTRYFGFFYRPDMDLTFPDATHSESGENGKKKWKACRDHINVQDEGVSIFGREFNDCLPKNLRRPLSPNSQKRIAAGIKKYAPEFTQFISLYYGGNNPEDSQSLDMPLRTVTTVNRNQLVKVEELNFITSYYGATGEEFRGQSLDQPLATVTTANRHQLILAEKLKFIMDHCHTDYADSLDSPLRTQMTQQTKQKVTVDHFLAQYYGTIQTQSMDAPLNT